MAGRLFLTQRWVARSQDGGRVASLPTIKMAACEKRRSAPAPATGSGLVEPVRAGVGGREPESEAEFLLQAGVTSMVREALLKVLEARPEEPVSFLASYFEKLVLSGPQGGAAADRHRQQQRLVRALWTAFHNNVSMAYECLSARGRRKKPGVNGRIYSELLRKICQDGEAPEEVVSSLLTKIQCRDHEAVPFDVFRYGVLSCVVLLEFVAKADTLYDVLDDGSGMADKRVCQAVLGTLEDALGASDFSVPIRYLEAGSKLGPDCLALAMDKALLERKICSSMNREEFLKKATALFIAKVKPID
ncbi:tubulin polyglutamylase complex subunit 1 isoform X2 [Malaclemys terrapin pileata]|uniref:tubulin polyglutamylase complex subunit 1 isoform X2 n=1 Tax=Malaclemys terrapin pileata TaxID=2991368 RepID=UPI0023A8C0CB|nr:tubulin polyglutamylase complex subunit 1 isoform X2 [Malaclemys terrapin pileata]